MDETQQECNGRTVMFSGEVNSETISECISSIFSLYKKSKEPIEIIVSSEGGEVMEALALIDIIEFVKARGVTVHTIALGKVMSCGVYIFASGTDGSRFTGPHTRFMLHGVSSETYGTLIEMKNELKETKRLQDALAKYLEARSNLSKKQLDKISAKCDNYFDASQAIEWGIADNMLK